MDGRDHDFDVFVSFAAADDRPLGDDGAGCVSLFCKALQRFAKIHLKRDLTVGLSAPLPSLDGVPPAEGDPRVGTPENAALFIAVLSPTYVSPSSMDQSIEAELFASIAADQAGSRMFSAVTKPVDRELMLSWLRDAPTYDLFDAGGVSKLPVAASELARDLVGALNRTAGSSPRMRSGEASSNGDSSADSEPRPAVFLAHTDNSVRTKRDELRAELERAGYVVLPKGQPARSKADIVEEAEKALDTAVLSIHLFGDEYDEAARLECRAAGDMAETGSLARFVWIGAEDAKDPDLLDLFEDVEAAPDGTHPFRRTSIETFKTSVLDALSADADLAASSGAKPDPSRKYVYLLYDQADEKWTLRLQRYLGRDCVVWTPLFEGSAREIDEQHRENLATCDASLLVYGAAPQAWWKSRTREFLVRGQPGAAVSRAYYMVEPMTREKQGFSEPRTRVIHAGERFSRSDIDAFMAETGIDGGGASTTNGSEGQGSAG